MSAESIKVADRYLETLLDIAPPADLSDVDTTVTSAVSGDIHLPRPSTTRINFKSNSVSVFRGTVGPIRFDSFRASRALRNRSVREHADCLVVECPPFGVVHSCAAVPSLRIASGIRLCKSLLPFMDADRFFADSISEQELKELVDSHYPLRSISLLQPHRFRTLSNSLLKTLSTITSLQRKVAMCQREHISLPSDHASLKAIENVQALYEYVERERVRLVCGFWEDMDKHPESAEVNLRNVIDHFSGRPDLFEDKIPFLDLKSLNHGFWLTEAVVNYFLSKWCSDSGRVLVLDNFFSGKFLFERLDCFDPREDTYSEKEETDIRRSCCAVAKELQLDTFDSVFLPICEKGLHWYSARIDYCLKRIDIYDSLSARFIDHYKQLDYLQKKAQLMQVLIHLAETLSQVHGDNIQLSNNADHDWIFDPHFKVYPQTDKSDSAVHMLWHLRHVCDFRQVNPSGDCSPAHLKFTDNMDVKRLRLVHDFLVDMDLL